MIAKGSGAKSAAAKYCRAEMEKEFKQRRTVSTTKDIK